MIFPVEVSSPTTQSSGLKSAISSRQHLIEELENKSKVQATNYDNDKNIDGNYKRITSIVKKTHLNKQDQTKASNQRTK